MPVKGCYASICHGLTIISTFLNLIVGIVLAVVGTILSTDILIKAYHLQILGYVLMGFGGFVFSNGFLGLWGSFKEKLGLIKTNVFLSITQILVGITVLVLFMISNKKPEQLRIGWDKVADDMKPKVEIQFHCCGFDDIKDGTEGCKFKKPCGEYLPPYFKKKVMTGGAVVAVGLIAAAVNLFGAFCLQKKMKKQMAHDRKKEFASLADESRGITRKERSRREREKRHDQIDREHRDGKDKKGSLDNV